jgi:hypothetical protein
VNTRLDHAQIARLRAAYPWPVRLRSRLAHLFGYHVAQVLVVSNSGSGFSEGLAVCIICEQELPELRPDAATMREIMAGPDNFPPAPAPTRAVVNLDSRRTHLAFWLTLYAYRLVRHLAPHSHLHRAIARRTVPYVLAWEAAYAPRRPRRPGSVAPRAKRLIARRSERGDA